MYPWKYDDCESSQGQNNLVAENDGWVILPKHKVFQNLGYSTNQITFSLNLMSLNLFELLCCTSRTLINTLYHSLTECPLIQTYKVLSDL